MPPAMPRFSFGNTSLSIDIEFGVRDDSPTPINALDINSNTTFLANPVNAVIELHKNNPKAIILVLLSLSPRAPIKILHVA